jgi:hypothetical protein
MSPILVQPDAHDLSCELSEVPAFPGEIFRLGYPEAIGDAAAPLHRHSLDWRWTSLGGGALRCSGGSPGELAFEMLLVPGEDVVSVRFTLTNQSTRLWEHGMAFNCFGCGKAPSVRDHDCVRHHVGTRGGFRRLVELPRTFGPRPTVQLYGVDGAPPPEEVPFVAGFQATSSAVLEPWIAIVARDGQRLAATAAKPGLFLFQNREYSCIHAGTGFGPMAPGATAAAENRVYLAQGGLDEWYARYQAEVW